MDQSDYELRITRPDRWEIFSRRHKTGWVVDRGIIGGTEGHRAVVHGSRHAGTKTTTRRLLMTFQRVDTIDWETTERLMLAFLEGNTAPTHTAWMTIVR
jgi:hypothetical protein